MNPETISFLKELADKLGTTATHIIELYAHQALIDSISSCILFTLSTTLSLVSCYATCKWYSKVKNGLKDSEKDGYYGGQSEKDKLVFISVLLCAIAVVYLAIALAYTSNASTIMAGFFNPEYVAINNILDKIK